MRIAIVSDAVYPYNKGGKEKKIYEITTNLASFGHDVHVYTMKWWPERIRIKKEQGVYLHAISPFYPLYTGKRRSFKEAIFFSLHCFALLKEKFDIIDVDHMPHLVIFPIKIICLLKRKKLFVSWNEVWGKNYWEKYIGKLGIPAYYIEKASAALPDRIISISDLTTAKLKNEFKRIDGVYTVPMGINYQEIAGIQSSDRKTDVIFAGRLLDNKNVNILISAIAYLKDVCPSITCTIIGEGPERANLEQLIREYSLEKQIKIIDFLPRPQQLYAMLKSSKVFAFPSTREGFGIVVLEANACGIPAVVADHPDNASRYLVQPDTGSVVKLDAKLFAEAILRHIQTDSNSGTISRSVRDYDWKTIAVKTLEVYRR